MKTPRRVLIVEDDAFVSGLLAELLRTHGFEVDQASNAGAAAKRIDAFDPDALVVDLDLGEGPTGLDLIDSLGDRLDEFGIVVLSHYPSTQALQPNVRLPERVGFITKRQIADPSHVVETLEKSLNGVASASGHGPRPPEFSHLTKSQFEVLRLIALGCSNEEIARRRGITVRATENLVSRLFAALGLESDARRNARVAASMMYVEFVGVPRDIG